MPVIYVLLIACCTALLCTPLVRYLAQLTHIVDQPNGRKVHQTPVPLLGGVSIAISIGFTALAVMHFGGQVGMRPAFDLSAVGPIFCGAAIVFCIGLWDDTRPLPVWVKLLFQAVAAGVAVGFGIRIDHVSLFGGSGFDLGIWAIPLSFLWIVGITNAFNLLDGLDGLVCLQALILGLTLQREPHFTR